MQKYLLIFALSCLPAISGFTGCASGTSDLGAVNKPILDRAQAQRTVYTAKEAYIVAESLATAYAKLPRCATPPVQPCSDQAILDQAGKAKNATRAALDVAQGSVDNPQFGADAMQTAIASVTSAMAHFSAITAAFGK